MSLNLNFILTSQKQIMSSAPKTFSLDHLLKGDRAIVREIESEETSDGRALVVRLNALGINIGKEVSVMRLAWLGGPMLLRVNQVTQVAIRRSEARCVVVEEIKGDEPST
ncbi:FeoA family protein [Pseudovibrio sp. Ad26]|jgi:ferrous iron transport protein A|uniref:FeoA family protein n=2 Tax=Pseudovibrio TaxID=258255 RepID=UPI0007AE3CBB|nr:FeoA family protein [Pseudovibrio sp. Ad26]KZL05567.1 FeoA domain protein [Pseudovibrio sp. Ad26]